jgi:hypothetical protein
MEIFQQGKLQVADKTDKTSVMGNIIQAVVYAIVVCNFLFAC